MKTSTFNYILTGILMLSFAFSGFSAPKPLSKARQHQIILKADDYFNESNYKLALNLYLKILKVDESNFIVNYKTGLCYMNMPYGYNKSIEHLKKATFSWDTIPESFYCLGVALNHEEQYVEALHYFDIFLNFIKHNKNGQTLRNDVYLRMKMCENAIEISKNSIPVKISNLKEINSEYDDLSPNYNSSTSSLYFSSKRKGSKGYFLEDDGSYPEDIYVSFPKSIENQGMSEITEWMKVKKGPSNLNTIFSDRILCFSSDGKQMLISKSGDIYLSVFGKKSWNNPVRLNSNINSRCIENSAAFSTDGNTIYFSSNRKGGYGGMDIYKSERITNGDWGPASNLGSSVNSSYDEDYPFFYEGSATLYFSSKRADSMGGFDIYESSLSNNSWSHPKNLGYPLNGPGDDISFVLDKSGVHGLYSSDRKNGVGNLDIYEAVFPIAPRVASEKFEQNQISLSTNK